MPLDHFKFRVLSPLHSHYNTGYLNQKHILQVAGCVRLHEWKKKTPLLTKNCISKILLQHGGSEPISILYAGIIIKIFKTRVILAYVTIGILQGTIVLLSIFSYIHDKNINQQCKTRVNTLAPPTNFLIKMIG